MENELKTMTMREFLTQKNAVCDAIVRRNVNGLLFITYWTPGLQDGKQIYVTKKSADNVSEGEDIRPLFKSGALVVYPEIINANGEPRMKFGAPGEGRVGVYGADDF